MQWLFNGRAIHQDKNTRARAFDDNVCALEILEVTPETSGTYTAVAHNIYGDAHSSAEVSLATEGWFFRHKFSGFNEQHQLDDYF